MSIIRHDEIFDEMRLNVLIGDIQLVYTRKYGNSGIPYYLPYTDESQDKIPGKYMGEVIFLPITKEEIEKNCDNYFFGFLYGITSNGHTTLSLIWDPSNIAISNMQIQFEIRRIRYLIEGNNITINKIYDPLFPPAAIDITNRSTEIGNDVNSIINSAIDSYCSWYIDKRI